VKVAIVGKVNVGKSSLFNQLLDRRRAIVTGIPGTTTDVIEEVVTLSGVLIRLMDMAGLREPGDEVEQEGVRFAKEKLSEADLVLLVLDRSGPLNDEDRRIFRQVEGRKAIVALNKIDLPAQLCEEENIRKEVGINDIYPTSALRGDGIDALKRGLVDTIMKGKVPREGGDFIPVNLRHKRVFERGKEALEEVVEGLERGIPWDITAIEIKRVLGLLGEIVGETTPEAVLEAIFSRFCIGK
jgi:tRNA modification GTPase